MNLFFVGQVVGSGQIIARQNGTRWHPGKHVKMARDFTIYSMIDGLVSFSKGPDRTDTDGKKAKTIVSVVPHPEPSRDEPRQNFYLSPVIMSTSSAK